MSLDGTFGVSGTGDAADVSPALLSPLLMFAVRAVAIRPRMTDLQHCPVGIVIVQL